MEPNLANFMMQYDLAGKLGDYAAQRQIAEQACEYSARWIRDHPELVDQGSRMASQIQAKFQRIKPEHVAKVKDAFDKIRLLRNASLARDIQKNLPRGTTWRDIMDFARQAWGNAVGGMRNIGASAMRMFSSMGRSAREIGMGIGGIMTAMASGAATWIVDFLGGLGLTVSGVIGAIAAIAVACLIIAILTHCFKNNKPAQRDPLLESWDKGTPYTPPNPYHRPQNL